MKRLISLTILAALILGLLTGCGSEAKPEEIPETTTAPRGSGITGEEILDSFEDLVATSEVADYYTLTRRPAVDLPDTGETYQSLVITDTLLGYTSNLSVQWDSKGDATTVRIFTIDSEQAFPLFCAYMYRAIGLPSMDAMDFYDTFKLLSSEPEGRMTVDGWELWAFCVDTDLFFFATYKAQ